MKLNIYIGEKVSCEHLAREINDSDCRYHAVNDTYLLQEHEQREFLERLKRIDKSAQWEEKKLASIREGNGLVELRKTFNVSWSDRLPEIEHIHLYGIERNDITTCNLFLTNELIKMCRKGTLEYISLYFLTNNVLRTMGGDLIDELIDVAQEWHCQYLLPPYSSKKIIDGSELVCDNCPYHCELMPKIYVASTQFFQCTKTNGVFRRKENAGWKLFVNEDCPYYVEHYMKWLKEKNNANVHRATK